MSDIEDPTPEAIEEALVGGNAEPQSGSGDTPGEEPSAADAAVKYAPPAVTGSANTTGARSNTTAKVPANLRKIHDSGRVDLDLDERVELRVKLGGRVWNAVEPTIEVNKKLSQALPTLEEGDNTSEAALAALNSIYPQIREVLVDAETGQPPSVEFVEKYLTGRNFGRLMEKLNTSATEGNGTAG